MTVTLARRVGFDVLRRVETEGAYASDLLHAELGSNIMPADAALATELTLGVLRWRGLLDFLLERHLLKPMARLDMAVALSLRMGLYQLRFLQRIPPRAAVNESVELVKLSRKKSAATLVNAVLRKASAEAAIQAEKFLPPGLDSVGRLSILHSHPRWLVERWLARFGEFRTVALLEANNRVPRLSCVAQDPSQRGEVIRELECAGLRVCAGQLLKAAFSASGRSPMQTDAFRKGKFSIQDEASQAVPILLDVQPGDRVLDLCAAPGGKTALLARASGGTGVVIAADRRLHRLRAMSAQLERLGFRGIPLVALDAAQPLPFQPGFARILVDAPCSGTGTLARHPEIRWRLRPEQLSEFHELQVRILTTAIQTLGHRGRLVYSTCSLEPEENENVVAKVLQTSESIRPVEARETAPALAPYLASTVAVESLFDRASQFRTFPGEQPTDGFFAAVLEKL
jgi:16S rRNA (cytosine967-C5)-methyltransferase